MRVGGEIHEFVNFVTIPAGLTGDFVIKTTMSWTEDNDFYRKVTVSVYGSEVTNIKKAIKTCVKANNCQFFEDDSDSGKTGHYTGGKTPKHSED